MVRVELDEREIGIILKSLYEIVRRGDEYYVVKGCVDLIEKIENNYN